VIIVNQKTSSLSVSRILSIPRRRDEAAIYLGGMLPLRSLRPTRMSGDEPLCWRHSFLQNIPTWSCSGWGLPGNVVANTPVRSYRTISPLPRRIGAVFFLLHFPSPFSARTLSGILPVEFGLSSPAFQRRRLPDRLEIVMVFPWPSLRQLQR
jgi:hypothetical protein